MTFGSAVVSTSARQAGERGFNSASRESGPIFYSSIMVYIFAYKRSHKLLGITKRVVLLIQL